MRAIDMESKPKASYADMRDAFFEELYCIAKNDANVILLIGDQGAASFEKFRKEIPSQIINVGVSEQNMISTAAGLTMGGKKVFAHAIATFLTLRCYEQIKVDISIMNLPVTLVGVGAGFAYGSDGPTHHSNQDLAAMRAIPGMTIFNASDTVSVSAFPHLAYRNAGPTYVRFDKGNYPPLYTGSHDFAEGIAEIRPGKDLTIISTGIMVHRALEVALRLQEKGIEAGVIDMYRIKPLNEEFLRELIQSAKRVVTLEEHLAYGGLGTVVCDFLCDHNFHPRFTRFGLADAHCFVYGDRDYMHEKVGLDAGSVTRNILRWLEH